MSGGLITDNPIQRFWQKFFDEVSPALIEAWNKIADVAEEITGALEEVQEREKNRAYEHLITPPLDHTMSHVIHTSTKPPHPIRVYRRRTP